MRKPARGSEACATGEWRGPAASITKRQVTVTVKLTSFGTGPVRTQSVVYRVPLLQHVQMSLIDVDVVGVTQMAALVDERWKRRNL